MVNIDISASGNAAAVIAATQAAIDSLHGKTVNIDVNVRQNGALRDLAAFGRANDIAARAQEQQARASDRAAASVSAQARASERASVALGGLGDSAGRAGSTLGGLGASATRSSAGMDRAAGSSSRMASSHRYSARESGNLSRSLVSAGLASADFTRAATGLLDVGGKAARGLGGLGAGALGAGSGLSELGAAGSRAAGVFGSVGSAVATVGTALAYGAAGSGILTAAVGALGAVGVGALGGVGAAAGAAGGAMAAFAIDAHKDSARFGADLEQMGKAAHLGAQAISEPMAEAMVGLGRAMVGADNVMTPAGAGIVSSLREGFGNAAGVVSRSSGSIVDAAATAAAGFARLTGEAAPGVEAFLGTLPSLTQGAVSGMSQITSEFGRSAGAIEGAAPALNRVMGAAGGLGAELVRIGAGSIVPFSENVTSMLGGATAMATQLAPAIKPSMQAFTDLAGAGMGAIGALAPEIGGFARSVSANAGSLQSAATSIGRGMLAIGEGAVEGVAAAAPALDSMSQQLQRWAPAAGRAAGQSAGVLADIFGGAIEGAGMAQESGETVKGAVDSVLGTTRDSGGRITGWGSSVAGGPARSMWGYAEGGGAAAPGGGVSPGTQTADFVGKTAGSMLPPGPPMASPSPMSTVMGGARVPVAARAPVSAGAGDMFSSAAGLAGIPAGVQQAQSALNTLPTTANTAMTGTKQALSAGSAGAGAAVAPGMQRLTRAVESAAAPAAAAGGKVGAAVGGGVAAGTTSSMTIVDTIMVKRIQQVKESAMGAMNAKSPSRDFEKIGGYVPQGFDRGVIKGFDASAASAATADSIAARGSEAMAATGSAMRGQEAEADRYRSVLQSMVIKVPNVAKAAAKGDPRVAMPAPVGALMPWTDEERAAFAGKKGTAKQEAFGETPGGPGARQVFDKKVFGFEAKPGVEMGTGKSFSNDMVQSQLQGKQRTAMEAVQGWADNPGTAKVSTMFGERTQQNIMRNRPGAMNVAGAIGEHEARQQGANSGQGWLDGLKSKADAIGIGGANLAAAGHKGYKKKDEQRSPSAVWAGMAGNSVAGLAGGFAASTGTATGAVSNMAGAMQSVANDASLPIGYTFGRNVITGIDTALKTANYEANGVPMLAESVMAGLGGSGLLGPALGGANVARTPSVKFGGGAYTPPRITSNTASRSMKVTIPVQIPVSLDGQVVREIATEVTVEGIAQFIEQYRDAQ